MFDKLLLLLNVFVNTPCAEWMQLQIVMQAMNLGRGAYPSYSLSVFNRMVKYNFEYILDWHVGEDFQKVGEIVCQAGSHW